jgi:hypothetical protein
VKATKIAEYPFKVRSPAQELHITPGITENSLLSTSKFAAANYITIFNKEEVNIYDANDTIITVTRGAILRSFKCPMTGMWRIPLVNLVQNNNTKTIIVNRHSKGQNFDLAKYIGLSTRYEYSIQYIVSYNTIHCF